MSDYEFATFTVKVDLIVHAMLATYLTRSKLKAMQRKETYDIIQHRHLFNDAILNLPITTKILPLPKKTSKVTIWIERDAEEALSYMIQRRIFGTTSVDAIINTAIAQWIPEVVKREVERETQ